MQKIKLLFEDGSTIFTNLPKRVPVTKQFNHQDLPLGFANVYHKDGKVMADLELTQEIPEAVPFTIGGRNHSVGFEIAEISAVTLPTFKTTRI